MEPFGQGRKENEILAAGKTESWKREKASRVGKWKRKGRVREGIVNRRMGRTVYAR